MTVSITHGGHKHGEIFLRGDTWPLNHIIWDVGMSNRQQKNIYCYKSNEGPEVIETSKLVSSRYMDKNRVGIQFPLRGPNKIFEGQSKACSQSRSVVWCGRLLYIYGPHDPRCTAVLLSNCWQNLRLCENGLLWEVFPPPLPLASNKKYWSRAGYTVGSSLSGWITYSAFMRADL